MLGCIPTMDQYFHQEASDASHLSFSTCVLHDLSHSYMSEPMDFVCVGHLPSLDAICNASDLFHSAPKDSFNYISQEGKGEASFHFLA
mmetsp:Transcript_1731/g.3680  ORF Transcript_1731/g.3680 Transcript_1731/m.3680 type:complete len:88 (-) Transcript_1731:1056-1319(-)